MLTAECPDFSTVSVEGFVACIGTVKWEYFESMPERPESLLECKDGYLGMYRTHGEKSRRLANVQ